MVVGIDDVTKRVVYFTDDAEAGLMQVRANYRAQPRTNSRLEINKEAYDMMWNNALTIINSDQFLPHPALCLQILTPLWPFSQPSQVPRKILESHEAITLHTELVDSHIYLCSPEVLWRFNESFDYADLRKDFIAMEVADLELGQMVFAETLQDGEYSGRVQDPRAYHAVCGDLLQRWIFPMVPEHAIGGLTTRYRRSHTTVGTNVAAGCVGGARTIYKDTR